MIIEQPVWRGAGSPHAIPGKEWHTTIFHTSIGKSAVSKMELKEIPFDQGAEPINVSSQKTTSLWCTKKVFPLVMNKFGSLKTSMKAGSLSKPRLGESGAFSTAGSEVYTPAMCEMLAEVAHELLKTRRSWAEVVSSPSRRLGDELEAEQVETAMRASASEAAKESHQNGTTMAPVSVSAHGWDFEINARDASTSMIDPSKFKWKSKPVHILLDSCSDAHIFCDRDAFITYLKPDLPAITVGKEGEQVEFEAMGTVLIGLPMTSPSGETVPMAVMIEKAYLPKRGQSSLCILSTGRLFEKQGIKITLNGMNILEIGEYSYKFGTRNYSPFVTATIPDSQGGGSRPRVSALV